MGVGTAALAAAGMLPVDAAGQVQPPYPGKEEREGKPYPTKDDPSAQNPDSFLPPPTDAGVAQTFKYPFSIAHKRMQEGGWSREVTIRNLRFPKRSLASICDEPPEAYGSCIGTRPPNGRSCSTETRITGLDAEGKSFVADITEGDLWYFPTGIPRSIQGLNPNGCEFFLVFDDGNFSEYETVLLTDWMAHTPHGVLSKNFGVNEQSLTKLPRREKCIFQAPVPGPLNADLKATAGSLGLSKVDFAFRRTQQAVSRTTKGGEVRIVDSSTFKVSTTIAAAIVTAHPGGIRELPGILMPTNDSATSAAREE